MSFSCYITAPEITFRHPSVKGLGLGQNHLNPLQLSMVLIPSRIIQPQEMASDPLYISSRSNLPDEIRRYCNNAKKGRFSADSTSTHSDPVSARARATQTARPCVFVPLFVRRNINQDDLPEP